MTFYGKRSPCLPKEKPCPTKREAPPDLPEGRSADWRCCERRQNAMQKAIF